MYLQSYYKVCWGASE